MNQIVTFGDNESLAPVTVPVLPDAPNPGEADVTLTITPINPPPHLTVSDPLKLRIFASKEDLPPTIVSAQGTPQGIVVTFSKPMDPASASDVKNYAVRSPTKVKYDDSPVSHLAGIVAFYGSLGTVWPTQSSSSSYQLFPLKSARYDPASNSVTLIPQRKLPYKAHLSVTEGTAGGQKKSRLADEEGNPVNGAEVTPGRFFVPITMPKNQPAV